MKNKLRKELEAMLELHTGDSFTADNVHTLVNGIFAADEGGGFEFVEYDDNAFPYPQTIGDTTSSITGLGPADENMLKTIFIMPNKGTDSTATLMIVVDEKDPSTDPKTYQYVYVGNINDLPSDVLTEGSIVNDLDTGGTDKPLSAEQGRTLNSHVNYTTCGSGAADQVKLISDDGFELSTHLRLLVRMNNINTHATPKFNINNTGAKDVWYNGTVASDTNTWSAGEVLDVYYDGTKYIATTYGGAQFSTGEKVGNVGIDNEPIANSNNLVKSDGIYENIIRIGSYSAKELKKDVILDPSFLYVPCNIQQNHKYIFYLTSPTQCSWDLRVTNNTTVVQTVGSFTNSKYIEFDATGNGNYLQIANLSSSVTDDKKCNVYEVINSVTYTDSLVTTEVDKINNGKSILNTSHTFSGVAGYQVNGYKKYTLYEVEVDSSDETYSLSLLYLNNSGSYSSVGVLDQNNNKLQFILPDDLGVNGSINFYHGISATQVINIEVTELGVIGNNTYNNIKINTIENELYDKILLSRKITFNGVSATSVSNIKKNTFYQINVECVETFSLVVQFLKTDNTYKIVGPLNNSKNSIIFYTDDSLSSTNPSIALYHGDSSNQQITVTVTELSILKSTNNLMRITNSLLSKLGNNTIISVKKDGSGDFTSIQSALSSIINNSETNRYEIQIFDDWSYTDSDLVVAYENPNAYEVFRTKPYVSLKGMNGIRTLELNLSSGNTNAQICYWNGWVNLYNLHFKCSDARYALHIESSSCENSEMMMDNCILEYEKCTINNWKTQADALGCGAYSNHKVICVNSKFKGIGRGFAVHSNVNPKPLPFNFIFENCLFEGDESPDIVISEFGQNNDTVLFKNCRFINNSGAITFIYGKTDCWDKLLPSLSVTQEIQITSNTPVYAIVAKNGARVTGGTAYNDIIGGDIKIGSKWIGNIIINDFVADIPNANQGHLGNYHFALGNRLGDCSVSNKTLIVDVNGSTKTVIFDQKYSNGEDSEPLYSQEYIISYINTELGGDYIEVGINAVDVIQAINVIY